MFDPLDPQPTNLWRHTWHNLKDIDAKLVFLVYYRRFLLCAQYYIIFEYYAILIFTLNTNAEYSYYILLSKHSGILHNIIFTNYCHNIHIHRPVGMKYKYNINILFSKMQNIHIIFFIFGVNIEPWLRASFRIEIPWIGYDSIYLCLFWVRVWTCKGVFW